jgi:transposase InsO family protein
VEVFAVAEQTAETVARLFVKGVVCRHGVPREFLSDRGGNFLSELMQAVCKLMGVKKLNTSGYHPQCNGLVECFSSTLIQMLEKVTENSKDWQLHNVPINACTIEKRVSRI